MLIDEIQTPLASLWHFGQSTESGIQAEHCPIPRRFCISTEPDRGRGRRVFKVTVCDPKAREPPEVLALRLY